VRENAAKSHKSQESCAALAHRVALTEQLTFEVVPIKSLPAAIEALPMQARVSVTCSPTKGLEATQTVTADLLAAGFDVVPHIAARMVRDAHHVADLAAWCRGLGLEQMFIVAGDAEVPGDYLGAVEFLRAFLAEDHGLDAIGVTGYPDGHARLGREVTDAALHTKQAMLTDAGVDAWCSTQMCFNPIGIAKWLRVERERGLTMPVHLGIAGVVDRKRLLTMGARLGIGDSLRYLRKNRSAVVAMMTASDYNPDDLLVSLSSELVELHVTGLHVFTFNQVAATEKWRQAALR